MVEEHLGFAMTDFVDDLLGVGRSHAEAWDRMQRLVAFLLDVGVPVSTKEFRLKAPAQVQTWVGWSFNIIRGCFSKGGDDSITFGRT